MTAQSINSPTLGIDSLTELTHALEELLQRLALGSLPAVYGESLSRLRDEWVGIPPAPTEPPQHPILRVSDVCCEVQVTSIELPALTLIAPHWFKQGEIVHLRVPGAPACEHTCRIIDCRDARRASDRRIPSPYVLSLDVLFSS